MTADKLCETCRELMGDASYIITPFFTMPAQFYISLILSFSGVVWLIILLLRK